MIHIVGAAGHMVVRAARNAIGSGPLAVLRTVGETVPLPVVDAVLVLPPNTHLLELRDVRTVRNVHGAARQRALAARLQDLAQVAKEVVAATRTDPRAKVAAQVADQLAGRRESVGELGVEIPEALGVLAGARLAHIDGLVGIVVVVPTVVDNIGVKRPHALLDQLAVDLLERIQDVLVVDVHHVVEPGVVLNTELRRGRDVIDVVEEVGLDHRGVRAARGARDSLPGAVVNRPVLGLYRLLVSEKSIEVLAAVVADAAGLLLDLAICHGELAAKEHALDVDGLTKVGLELLHLDNSALAGGNGPLVFLRNAVDLHGLKVDVVDSRHGGLVARDGDIQELPHVVIAIEHDYVLGYVVRDAIELERLKVEAYNLAISALSAKLSRCGGDGNRIGVVEDELACRKITVVRGFCRVLGREQVELGTAGEGLSILAIVVGRHGDKLNPAAGGLLIKVHVDGVHAVVGEVALRHRLARQSIFLTQNGVA